MYSIMYTPSIYTQIIINILQNIKTEYNIKF